MDVERNLELVDPGAAFVILDRRRVVRAVERRADSIFDIMCYFFVANVNWKCDLICFALIICFDLKWYFSKMML